MFGLFIQAWYKLKFVQNLMLEYTNMSFSLSTNFLSKRVRAIINSTMMIFKHYTVLLSTAQRHIFKRESMKAG